MRRTFFNSSAFPALTAPFNGRVGCSHCLCWDSVCDYLLSNTLPHHVSPLAKSALGVLYILCLITYDKINHGHLMKAKGLEHFRVGEHLEVLGGWCIRMAWVCCAPLPYFLIWLFVSCIHYNKLVVVGKVLFWVLWVSSANHRTRGGDLGNFQTLELVGSGGPNLWLVSKMGHILGSWAFHLWCLHWLQVMSELNWIRGHSDVRGEKKPHIYLMSEMLSSACLLLFTVVIV